MESQEHRSKYGEKHKSGKQMYGGTGTDSCCAHRITQPQLIANRRKVAQRRGEGTYIPPVPQPLSIDEQIASEIHWEH